MLQLEACLPALGGSEGPASEAVGNVAGIAANAVEAVAKVGVVHRTTVVHASSGIVGASIDTTSLTASLLEGLLKTIAVLSSSDAIADHLSDSLGRAYALSGTASGAVVGLHKARVDHTVIGSRNTDAALRLLHHDGKDEAVIDASLAGNLLDSAPDVVDLFLRVVGSPAVPAAGLAHKRLVGIPELVEGAPSSHAGPACALGAVTTVTSVDIGSPGGKRSGAVASRDGSSSGRKEDGDEIEVGDHFE